MQGLTISMLRRQAIFAFRSVRDIVRSPSRGRHFGRMLKTLGRSTLDLRIPWLPFTVIDLLDESVTEGTHVFEYGGGGSTLWFLDHGAKVITVEHDLAWSEALNRTAGTTQSLEVLRRPLGASYTSAIETYPEAVFDVVVVDGRDRVECFKRAVSRVKPGGFLVLDDVDRTRYRTAFDVVNWPNQLHIGFAPCKPTLAYTAIFSRPKHP